MRASKYTTKLRYQTVLTMVSKGERMTTHLLKSNGCQGCTSLVLREMGYIDTYGKWVKDKPYKDGLVDELLELISKHRRKYIPKDIVTPKPVDLFTKVENNELRDFIDKLKAQYKFSTETTLVLDIIKNHFRK